MNFNAMYLDLMVEAGIQYPYESEYTIYFAYKNGKAKKFNTKEEAMQYSDNIEEKIDKAAYEAARKAYNQADSEATEKVIQAMKGEIGRSYGYNKKDNQLLDLIFSKAYEDGHPSGFNEIYNYLLDYDDLLKQAIKIIQS